jgi:hypothetical protein
MKEKDKELAELERKLSIKQRMDILLKTNDHFAKPSQKDPSSRKWSWNTSVGMVALRLQEERQKNMEKEASSARIVRSKSFASQRLFRKCRIESRS